MRRLALSMLLMLAATTAFSVVPLQDVVPGDAYSTVTVFYATDRAPTGITDPVAMFGSDRSQAMLYGMANVSIPRGHQPGVLEEARRWKLQFWPNPARDIVLLRVDTLNRAAFFSAVADRARLSRGNEVLVVVHGYWTSFEEAIRRAAQIKVDLNFNGPAVVYSWPSLNGWLQYLPDKNNAEWAVPHLRDLLFDIHQNVPSDSVSLIAHSLGNWITVHALQLLAVTTPAAHFDQIVLAAPDVDARTFVGIEPDIARLCRRVTLYASTHDQALWLSKKLQTGSRAGEAGPGLVVLDGMDTIDVGDVDSSVTGHSYVFENRVVIDDMAYCLRGESPANRCRLVRKQLSQPYWTLSQIVTNRVPCGLP